MIINMSGGGTPGKIVTVHVIYGPGVGSGATVTCTNENKTYTGITDANGDVVFKLTEGPWTITVKTSYSSSSKNINIIDDCTVDISLFAATIHVTYPTGTTCTVKNGTTIISSDNSGSFDFIIPNKGVWTVEYNGTSWQEVTITDDKQTETAYAGYLYYHGNELPNLTSGWYGSNITRGEDYIGMNFSGQYNSGYLRTVKAVKVGNCTTLKFYLSYARTHYGGLSVSILNSSGSAVSSLTICGEFGETSGEKSLAIPEGVEEIIVQFNGSTGYYGNVALCTFTMLEMRCE